LPDNKDEKPQGRPSSVVRRESSVPAVHGETIVGFFLAASTIRAGERERERKRGNRKEDKRRQISR
jgi:hypothetical protein